MAKTKIILFDLEVSPYLLWAYGTYDVNALEVERPSHLLSFSAKELGNKKVTTRTLADYPLYKRSKHDDADLVYDLWCIIDEADIVIAHNGDKFDIRRANARFLYHRYDPPEHYRSIDTLKIARKFFKFPSNRLDDLGEHLGVGRKEKVDKSLWLDCVRVGEKKHWAKMAKYNRQDVLLLEAVYKKLRSWHERHPNVNLVEGKLSHCAKCGKPDIFKKGFRYTLTTKIQRYQCRKCGAYSDGESTKITHIR